jgi:hypothetical protein
MYLNHIRSYEVIRHLSVKLTTRGGSVMTSPIYLHSNCALSTLEVCRLWCIVNVLTNIVMTLKIDDDALLGFYQPLNLSEVACMRE